MKELIPPASFASASLRAENVGAVRRQGRGRQSARRHRRSRQRAGARSSASPVEFMVAPNTGVLTDALEAGQIDASFMPVDEERKKRIDFGPAYCRGREHLHGDGGVRHQNGRLRWTGRRPRRRHRQHHDDPRRRPHLEEHHGQSRRSRSARRIEMMTRRQGRCLRAVARLAAADFVAQFPGSRIVEAASSTPASPSRCRRAGRRRWPT